MADINYMTRERVREIEEELHVLKTKGRREMAEKIAEARGHGDLSENADYDAAKNEQGLMEMKIARLEQLLAKAQIIDPNDFPDDKIYILSKVQIKNLKTQSIMEYTLVGDHEADFERKKLSVTSPIGKALMGKTVGDIVQVNVPAGIMDFEIINISK